MKPWAQRAGWVFDQGSTFMFGCDRFAADEDYALTYRRLGGGGLAPGEVDRLLHRTFTAMKEAYGRAGAEHRFPTFRAALAAELAHPLPSAEMDLLEATFAAHEVGTIEAAAVATLRAIAPHRRLALISNIFAPPAMFEALHRACGLEALFEVKLWSALEGTIKPDPALFAAMEERLGLPPEELVYIGDNWARDVVPSKARGWAAVWVNPAGAPIPPGGPTPDRVVSNVAELTSWAVR